MREDEDHDLFIGFYEQYKDKVFTYLMYRLNFNRVVAEDLLMDIFLKAYEKFKLYDVNRGSFKNWIFTIAHNRLVNHWRDSDKVNPLDGSTTQSADRLEDLTDKKMELKGIRRILTMMDKSNGELLSLRYVHDFSVGEMAEILKKREEAVRTALSRAVKQFKELYEKINNNNHEQ